MWFWNDIFSFPSDEWGKVWSMWIQRMGDSKVPMAAGEKGYLDMYMQPVSPEQIKKEHGGGKYRIILLKNNRYKTSHDFEIEGPPIYNSRERPSNGHAASNGDGNTALLQQFIGVLRDELARSRESNQGGTPGADRTIDMVSSAAEKAMEIVTRQVPPSVNPAAQLESLVNTAKGLGLFGGGGNGSGGIVDTIRVLKELGLIGQPAANPMEQLTMFLTLFEKLDGLRGGRSSGGGKADVWQTVAEKAFEHAPDIIREIREGREASVQTAKDRRAAMEAQRATAEALRSVPGATATSPTSVRVPVAQNAPQNAATATPAGETAAPAPTASGPLRTVRLDAASNGNGHVPEINAPLQATDATQQLAFDENGDAPVEWTKRRLVKLLQLGQSGVSIVDWLDGTISGFSDQLVQYTPEQVTAFFKADPILAAAANHPRWEQVLAEARDYILDESESDDPAIPK